MKFEARNTVSCIGTRNFIKMKGTSEWSFRKVELLFYYPVCVKINFSIACLILYSFSWAFEFPKNQKIKLTTTNIEKKIQKNCCSSIET